MSYFTIASPSSYGVNRPGTPFPSSSLVSKPHQAPVHHYSRSLHFTIPELPSRTPPSLLKRQSSSGSNRSTSTASTLERRSSSASNLSTASTSTSTSTFSSAPAPSPSPKTPALLAPTPRRPSTSSILTTSSISSPVLPSTPLPTPAEPLELPAPIFTSEDTEDVAEVEIEHIEVAATPARPALKRRDTPRPQTLSSLGLTMSSRVPGGAHLYRSVIDGGAWVVV